MNTNYFPSISLNRRATVPMQSPLAPTASMIPVDPHLDQYNLMQHQRASRSPAQMTMQNQIPIQMQSPMHNQMQNSNNHLQSPMRSNSTQQLQSPIQNSSRFQNAGSHVRTSQNVAPERNLPTTQVSDSACSYPFLLASDLLQALWCLLLAPVLYP